MNPSRTFKYKNNMHVLNNLNDINTFISFLILLTNDLDIETPLPSKKTKDDKQHRHIIRRKCEHVLVFVSRIYLRSVPMWRWCGNNIWAVVFMFTVFAGKSPFPERIAVPLPFYSSISLHPVVILFRLLPLYSKWPFVSKFFRSFACSNGNAQLGS